MSNENIAVGFARDPVISILEALALVLRYRAKLMADEPGEADFRQKLRRLLDECGKKSDFRREADAEHYRMLLQLFWEYYEAHDTELPDFPNPPVH